VRPAGVALAFVLLALGVTWGTSVLIARAASRAALERAPDLPRFSDEPEALRQALGDADRTLRQALLTGASSTEAGRAAGRLGELYHANGYRERAAEGYELAIELDPDNPHWPYGLAFLLQESGETDSVTKLLRRTVELAPDYSPAWLKLGETQFKQGQNEAARTSYERRLTLSEGDPYAHLGLARLALGESDWFAAESHLEKAIATDSEFGEAHRMLAAVHEHFNRSEQSKRALERAERCGRFYPAPDPWADNLLEQSFDVDWLLVNAFKFAYVRGGEIANLLFGRAMDLEPDNPQVYLMLGKTVQDLAQARRAFETAVSLDPTNAEAFSLLGEVLLKENNPNEAERVLRKAIDLGTELPTTYENLGLCLASRGRFAEAIASIRRAVLMEPELIDFHLSLASTLKKAGRVREAEEQYGKVLQLKPTHTRAAQELAALVKGGGA